MRAYYNSRVQACRNPYGAVAPGVPVSLTLDVWDAENASVKLRLWVDGAGETLYDMERLEDADECAAPGAARYRVTLSVDEPCVAWYHFVITDEHGNAVRYGAADGRTGGEGQLVDWEPPSYQLTVSDLESLAPWDDDGICYQYGSDVEGLVAHLDALRDAGVTSVRVNPLCGVGGAAGTDDVGDGVGEGEDAGEDDALERFSSLCREAHARNMKVIAACSFAALGVVRGGALAEDGVLADGGVVRRVVRAGADAWCLEQADEHPREFVASMKAAIDNENASVVFFGEVDGDASNRIAVSHDADIDGSVRRSLLGDEFDCAANAALIDAITGFARNEVSARDLVELIESLRENYPPEVFAHALNPLSRYGRARLMSRFGLQDGARDAAHRDVVARLDDGQRRLAKGRLWCASLVQLLMPGTPCIFYGDETGVEGFADGDDSRGFPEGFSWDEADADCQAIIQNVADLRRLLPVLAEGAFECFALNDDVFGFRRFDRTGQSACVLVNSSISDVHEVCVPMWGEVVSELIDGYGVPVVGYDEAQQVPHVDGDAGRYARVRLNQLGSAVLYFHNAQLLAKQMQPGLGVLAHITSLPVLDGETSSADGQHCSATHPGTLGAPARDFVDWLANAGVRYWQVLPVNPTDDLGSPYAGISAFAGNVALLELGSEGAAADIEAYDELAADANPEMRGGLAADANPEAYAEFCARESEWLESYASFMAIRQKVGEDVAWQDWPKKYRAFKPGLIERDAELAEYAERWRKLQFEFDCQWRDVRSYANERGVQIIGDMPIYVSANSADVWAEQELFQLDVNSLPSMVAGCPPDPFAAEGQVWGNPVYDWEAARADGYSWWLRRLKRAFDLYDAVRLDHFIGFARYYSIPAGEKAVMGAYHPGPGIELFAEAEKRFGPLPVIAEDLGTITPGVRALCSSCGFLGMDIVQFVDGNDPLAYYAPRPEKIVYTGTHDNQTLVGYVKSRYPDVDAAEAAERLLESAVTCAAPICIVPLQDVLGLDDEARMNVPGTTEGNWRWQASAALVKEHQQTLANLVALS